MKDINEMLNESLNEALQMETGKAVKDMFKHGDVSHIVIVRFNDEDMQTEVEQQEVYGPVATKDGKLYGIKNM